MLHRRRSLRLAGGSIDSDNTKEVPRPSAARTLLWRGGYREQDATGLGAYNDTIMQYMEYSPQLIGSKLLLQLKGE